MLGCPPREGPRQCLRPPVEPPEDSPGRSARPRRGRQPPQPLRTARHRLRTGRELGRTRRRAADRAVPGRLEDDPLSQRLARHRLRVQPEPLPRLRARLHLLLRPSHPRVPRLLRRTGLREPDTGQGACAGAAAKGAPEPALETPGHRALRRHRPVPANRTKAQDHPALPGGPGRVPQPGSDHHEEPPGHPRPRPARGAQPIPGLRRLPLDHLGLRLAVGANGATGLDPAAAVRGAA